MGVGNVKVIFQPGPARMLAVKNSNAIRAPVYPAPKPFIPSLDLQDGGGVRALGIDKQLLIKGKTVVAAEAEAKKCLPLVPELSHFAGFHGTAPSMLYRIAIGCTSFLLFFFCVFQLRAVISIRVILPAKGKQKRSQMVSPASLGYSRRSTRTLHIHL